MSENDTPESAVCRNYRSYADGGNIYAVRDCGEREPELFRRTGQTSNVRTLAAADAVIYDSQVLDVFMDTGAVILQDPWVGIQDRLVPEEWLDTDVATLERVEPLFPEGSSDE